MVWVYTAHEFLPCREALDVLSNASGEEWLGHFLGVGGVRGDEAVGQVPQGMADGKRLGVGHVQGRAADLPGPQGLDQRLGIDHAAPR